MGHLDFLRLLRSLGARFTFGSTGLAKYTTKFSAEPLSGSETVFFFEPFNCTPHTFFTTVELFAANG